MPIPLAQSMQEENPISLLCEPEPSIFHQHVVRELKALSARLGGSLSVTYIPSSIEPHDLKEYIKIVAGPNRRPVVLAEQDPPCFCSLDLPRLRIGGDIDNIIVAEQLAPVIREWQDCSYPRHIIALHDLHTVSYQLDGNYSSIQRMSLPFEESPVGQFNFLYSELARCNNHCISVVSLSKHCSRIAARVAVSLDRVKTIEVAGIGFAPDFASFVFHGKLRKLFYWDAEGVAGRAFRAIAEHEPFDGIDFSSVPYKVCEFHGLS
ncbi:hypothetical protein [Ensifer adhaerens]|uniref:hypothetical protein n=1 Tax=Ensifer adhaerens TaxID=106592 RepID=UPI001177C290|nr:hypothetical protein [Ensifer adhaerens]